ncbi:LacI family DNA-binding transcriptional regulator [Paraliobacillus sp. JSM ZJ581]|uniref:LacI family DNA-binding transcriptional regulator n=1 Tax=Paraliobacillus sp. JSM ZJ581 TaxID=3342118 RepID=UPI0035A89739
MATLKDVAKKANVSVSTASYAINGSSLITKATREKVLLAAKELGYHPNGSAKSLKRNKSEIIGLFLSGFTGPFFGELLEGIQDTVVQNGYELAVFASNERHRLLKERLVDGAIILNYHISNNLLENLANKKMPIVALDRNIENPFIEKVLLPNKIGIELAVEHLVEKSHTRIGFIAGSQESYDGETRLEAFKEVLQSKGLRFSESDLIRADFTEVSGLVSMNQYLEKKKDYPSAFISANDEMAMGAIKAIQSKAIHVPNQIAVIGFDDIQIAKYFDPPLTTVRVQKKEWGIQAVNTLIAMIEKEDNVSFDSVPVKLIQRSSS